MFSIATTKTQKLTTNYQNRFITDVRGFPVMVRDSRTINSTTTFEKDANSSTLHIRNVCDSSFPHADGQRSGSVFCEAVNR